MEQIAKSRPRSEHPGSEPALSGPPGSQRSDRRLALALFAVTAAIYGLGACPTIYVGDSGELVAAAYTLGVPHPSGYPLYVLLGKLWTLIVPLGSIAFRMSLFSVFTGAAAVAVLFRLARSWNAGQAASAVAALSFGLLPGFWSQANVQRVYTLNALMMALALWALSKWLREGSRPALLGAMFVAGLGAANHLYMGLAGGVMLAYGWWKRPESRLRPGLWSAAAGAFVAGLAPYVWQMLRSRADPRLDWGDPETPAALWAHMTRSTHWSRAWWEGWHDLPTIAGDYLESIGGEFLWVGAALAVFGIAAAWRRGWPVGLLLAAAGANFASMAAHGSHADLFIWHRYYVPTYLCVALFLAAGLESVRRRLPGKLFWLSLLLPSALLVSGWRQHDRSDFGIAEAFSRELLAGLPPGSHLAASDDNILFVLIYLDLVEGVRPDVNLIYQGVGGSELPPLRFEPGSEELYFTHHPNWQLDAVELVPRGPVFQVARAGSGVEPSVYGPEWLPGERDPGVPKDYLTRNLLGQWHYMRALAFEHSDWERSLQEFQRAVEVATTNDVLFYNLGLVMRRQQRHRLALEAFARADRINPRGIPSNRKALASDRASETRPLANAETGAFSPAERLLLAAVRSDL